MKVSLSWLHSSRRVWEGVAAGVSGALSVALWFFLGDAAAGRPLYTPAVIGSALFHGAVSAEEVRVTARIVREYSIVHIAVFLTLGVAISRLAAEAEDSPPLISSLLIPFLVIETLFMAALFMLGTWVLEELGWGSILVGNLLAARACGHIWPDVTRCSFPATRRASSPPRSGSRPRRAASIRERTVA